MKVLLLRKEKMDNSVIISITQTFFILILQLMAPVLLIATVVGLVISIFQTVTSIQEQTLTFVPKILAVFLVMMLCGSWMLNIMLDFFVSIC